MGITQQQRIERFWARVEPTGFCWLWTAGCFESGYGQVKWFNRSRKAHQVAWELLVGPVPEGLEPDHLCRVRNCINPDHIEWVTHAENTARAHMARGAASRNGRKTHCKLGHEFTPENTRIDPKGRRVCRACHRAKESARQSASTHCDRGHERTPEKTRIDASGRRRCAVCHPSRQEMGSW